VQICHALDTCLDLRHRLDIRRSRATLLRHSSRLVLSRPSLSYPARSPSLRYPAVIRRDTSATCIFLCHPNTDVSFSSLELGLPTTGTFFFFWTPPVQSKYRPSHYGATHDFCPCGLVRSILSSWCFNDDHAASGLRLPKLQRAAHRSPLTSSHDVILLSHDINVCRSFSWPERLPVRRQVYRSVWFAFIHVLPAADIMVSHAADHKRYLQLWTALKPRYFISILYLTAIVHRKC
jgi:hypothetical protein